MKIPKALLVVLLACSLLPARSDAAKVSKRGGEGQTTGLRTDPAEEAFTLVVIPDSQFMVCTFQGGTPAMFSRQMAWIKAHISDLNIKMVSHLGDIADCANDASQWEAVKNAMGGLEDVVPFGMAYGNHDCAHFGPNWSLSYRTEWLAEHFRPTFPLAHFSGKPWFGGSFPDGTMDNNYEFFSGGGKDFIILHLGWNPSPEVKTWADAVLKKHSDRRAILSTHEYNEDRLSAVGESIWKDVVRKNDNVFMVLSGHFNSRQKKLVMKNDFGHDVLAIMSDYQVDNPQKAFLRYYKFLPEFNKIQAYTFSTETLAFETGPDSQFEISYSFK